MDAFLSDLFPWLIGLYLFDAVVLIAPPEVLFSVVLGRFRGAAFGGVRAPLLTPGCQAVSAFGLPFPVLADTLLVPGEPLRADRPLPGIAEFRAEALPGDGGFASEGSSLQRGGRTLFATPSPVHARELAAFLEQVRGAPPGGRLALVGEMLDRTYDLKAFRSSWDEYLQASERGRMGGWVLLLGLFLLLPAALFIPPLAGSAGWLLLTLTVPWVVAIRGISPFLAKASVDRYTRVITVLHFGFLPVSAIRGWSGASRLLFARFDPLVVGVALLDRPKFVSFARRELARLKNRVRKDDGTPVREFWAMKEERARRLVREVLGSDFLPPPERSDQGAAAYCPVCSATYRAGVETCPDCDLALETFERNGGMA
jgi:hypothetical protein